jgi:hypothetical protein
MLKFRRTKLLILPLLLFLFLGASFILAQKPLEITYPQIPGVTAPTTTKEALPDYIRYIFQFSLFLGGLIALGSFIYGGVRYLTSAGSPSVVKDAKSRISAGILGLIILMSAYIILNTINPQLVNWEVSLPEGAPTARSVAGLPSSSPATYVEIPLGGLIENLWGTQNEPKKADCYKFDGNGDTEPGSLASRDRLRCIEWLSEAIRKKAENLKEPVEELRKLYDCQNCCQDCCKKVCDWAECSEICDWDEEEGRWENCPLGNLCCEGTQNEGCWESCGVYECCEGKGMTRQYYYQECPYSCCEYFQSCPCSGCCGFEEEWCERCNCICVREGEDEEPVCCNPENPEEHWEDLYVRSLIDKNLLTEEEEEEDPYPDLTDIKTALRELRLKLGLFPLTEELKKSENLDALLAEEDTENLIKEILIGEPVEGDKLKEILKIKSVMKYLIENGWLLEDRNSTKTMLIASGLLKNEVSINEIAWMGTQADPADEWIELYNNTKENISLSDWKLAVKDKFEVNLSGTIPAQGFYLLENNENAISDIKADLIYSGNLADSGETLELYDEFGNLVEEVDCGSGWFAGDESSRTSMERINPIEDGLDRENWATNLSIKVEEGKEDYINGIDKEGGPIYGTPKNPNGAGVDIISYSSFDSLAAELQDRLGKEESLKEKLILVLRNGENLERMLKTKEVLADILVGDDHLKRLLSGWGGEDELRQQDILRILIEDKDNLSLLLEDEHAKEVIKDILIRTGAWKEEADEEEEWERLLADLDEARTNLKLINDFQEDLLWVLDARNLMRGCEGDPISYDQLRAPGLDSLKIEEVPEWEEIKRESQIIEGTDPATFYCHKLLW